MSSIDIIIVNWNGGQLILDCLQSIADFGGTAVSRIIVVDNASSDGSPEAIKALDLPKLLLLENSENRGFSKACNQGAAQADAPYLLFLNPDTRLYETSLAHVRTFMDDPANAAIGICGICLKTQDGQDGIAFSRFPALSLYLTKIFGLQQLFPRRFPSQHYRASDLAKSGPVDQIIGAFFFVRHAVFRSLEGFDERFFVYFEEVDFCYRAKIAGFDSYLLKEARAFHLEHGTSDQATGARLFYSLQSRLAYARKHFKRWHYICLVLATGLAEPWSRCVPLLVKRRWSAIGKVLGAFAKLARAPHP